MAGTVLAQTAAPATTPGDSLGNLVMPPPMPPPAVSQVNGKVDYAGGEMDHNEGNNFAASLTLPVAHQFGFQADALYSRISDLNFYGGAGHLFWRNPAHGLLGLTGGYLYRDGADTLNTYQAGAEGQFYWRMFTFGAFAGVGSISYQYPAPFIDTNPTRFVGRISTDCFPLENLRVGTSYTSAFNDNLWKAEVEFQTPLDGLALTGEAAWGSYGYSHWLLGVRYYFGGKKTLRSRQREDDPPGLMPQILQSLGVYGAEFNHMAGQYVAANPGSRGSGVGDSGGGYGTITTETFRPINPIQLPPTPQFPTAQPPYQPPLVPISAGALQPN